MAKRRDHKKELTDRLEEGVRQVEVENTLLTGSDDRYGIYQIAEGTPANAFAFMGMDFVEKHGMNVCREDYQVVYSGILGSEDTLDSIYEKFNIERPEDFRGHSLSVSDIVLIHSEGNNHKCWLYMKISLFISVSLTNHICIAANENSVYSYRLCILYLFKSALNEFVTPLGPRTANIPYSFFNVSKVNLSGSYLFNSLIVISALITRLPS